MKRAQRRGSAGGCHLELLVLHPGKASKKPRPGLANFPESFTTNLDLRTEKGRSWNGNHHVSRASASTGSGCKVVALGLVGAGAEGIDQRRRKHSHVAHAVHDACLDLRHQPRHLLAARPLATALSLPPSVTILAAIASIIVTTLAPHGAHAAPDTAQIHSRLHRCRAVPR